MFLLDEPAGREQRDTGPDRRDTGIDAQAIKDAGDEVPTADKEREQDTVGSQSRCAAVRARSSSVSSVLSVRKRAPCSRKMATKASPPSRANGFSRLKKPPT